MALWPSLTGPASAQDACGLQTIGAASVAAVRDSRTIALSDGRELRLAGIEVDPTASPVLQMIVGGGTLRLARLGAAEDRYGRVVAFAYPGDGLQSLQQMLLAQGLARVAARVGDKGCADLLLAAEAKARSASLGLWNDPNFAPLPAENIDLVLSHKGQFSLVIGKVLTVRESGATIYVNFGRRWTREFTIVMLKRQQRTFEAAGIAPKQLEGHRIRVRGWIEKRGGPVIEAEAPEQIERID